MTAEGIAPFAHHRVIMRMRDGDRFEAARRLDPAPRFIVDERHAIPKHIAVRRLHQKRALADGKMRLDGNAGDTVIFLLEAKPVSRTQLLERRPGLAIPADELAIIRADRANRGRRGGFRELRAASDADEWGRNGLRATFFATVRGSL